VPDRDAVLHALDQIIDPASGQGLVTAGLTRGVVAADDRAGCALDVPPGRKGDYAAVRDQAEAALTALPGVQRVLVVLSDEGPPPAPPVQAPRPRKAGLSQAAVEQGRPKAPVPTDRPAHVRRVLAVASGKGGVGKSTVAVNLAAALAARGLSVGVLDADVYGPSLPTMVWRGPMASQAITQMLTQTRWGTAETPLDVLVVDLPPGTGDVQLTLIQKTPLDGAVIVSTPQEVALADARRGHALFQKVGVPTLGLIENMSGPVFGRGGAEAEAARLGVAFLGDLPLDAAVREAGDAGRPVVVTSPNGEIAGRFDAVAAAVQEALKLGA
jgi:ATP-binding protein involved in chromosome partitioning